MVLKRVGVIYGRTLMVKNRSTERRSFSFESKEVHQEMATGPGNTIDICSDRVAEVK